MRITLAIVLIAACSPWVSAQRMVSPPHFAPPQSGHGLHGNGGFGHHGQYTYPAAFFSYPFYDQALFDAGYPVASQPPVILLQSQPVPVSASATAQPAVQPLMIELQGDRYVRVSGEEDSRSEMIGAGVVSTEGARSKVTQLPATLLVFRDGHQEQTADYTIADGILYARGDFYSSGSWTKKIELSALDLPETIRANQSQGVPFHVPSAPNVVIVGP